MTISHVSIYVEPGKLDEMVNWYLTVLKPVGYKLHYDLRPNACLVGIGAMYPDFWIGEDPKCQRPLKEKLHICFSGNRQQVRDFHAIALKAGATDNGGPGLRPEYMKTYYAAYVFDPEGRNVEVMSITPGFIAEPKSRQALIAITVLALAVGLGYFTGLGAHLM